MIARAMMLAIRAWQAGSLAMRPPTCRFHPSCSAYAIEAVSRYGAARGGWLAARRLGRCRPFGGRGFDPVP